MAKIKRIQLANGQIYDIVDGGAVRYDEVQELDSTQQAQARENISAVSQAELENAKTTIKSEILGSAPEELNTLSELAAALGEDENFSTTILNQINQKPDFSDIPAIPEMSVSIESGGDLEVITGIEATLDDSDNTYKIISTSRTLSGDNTYIKTATYEGTNSYLISHVANGVAKNTNTTATPSFGETFEVLDSVEYDSAGHLTTFTKKTVTIPSLDGVEVTYSHPYGTSLPSSGSVGEVFLLLES